MKSAKVNGNGLVQHLEMKLIRFNHSFLLVLGRIIKLTSSETQDKMQSGFLLDVVVRQGAAILQLFAGKDQPLLVRGNSLLVLDLGLHILNGVRGLHFKCDGLASQGLHEDLHALEKKR